MVLVTTSTNAVKCFMTAPSSLSVPIQSAAGSVDVLLVLKKESTIHVFEKKLTHETIVNFSFHKFTFVNKLLVSINLFQPGSVSLATFFSGFFLSLSLSSRKPGLFWFK